MAGSANETQVGGDHYKSHGDAALQHWDMVRIFKLDYFQGNITKYLFRWRSKNGVQDLEKAAHYLQKYIEIAIGIEEQKLADAVAKHVSATVTLNEPSKGMEIQIVELKASDLASLTIEELTEELEHVSSSDLMTIVHRRNLESERVAMDEYARSQNGDRDDVLIHTGIDSGLVKRGGPELTDNENPIPDQLYVSQKGRTTIQCSGCGAVQQSGVMIHSADCPRLTDAMHLKPDASGAPNATHATPAGPGAAPLHGQHGSEPPAGP